MVRSYSEHNKVLGTRIAGWLFINAMPYNINSVSFFLINNVNLKVVREIKQILRPIFHIEMVYPHYGTFYRYNYLVVPSNETLSLRVYYLLIQTHIFLLNLKFHKNIYLLLHTNFCLQKI